MQIAIISDVHNNITNLKKVLDFCQDNDIKTIICCGDLASMETLDFLNDNYKGTIHYAFGNMDNDQLKGFGFSKKYKRTFLYPQFGEKEIQRRKIAFVHFPEIAKKLCETKKYRFVFYGHTHKPWTEKIGNCIMLNPGNVAGEIYPPSFAIWDIDNDSFKPLRIHSLK
jgi:uncharacterized protein